MSLGLNTQSNQTNLTVIPNNDSIRLAADSKESSKRQIFDRLVIQEWKKRRADKETSKPRLHDQAFELFKFLRKALETAAEQQRLSGLISDIKEFLTDEKKEHEIDDCIRWLVLDYTLQHCQLSPEEVGISALQTKAAEEVITAEKNVYIIIIRIIVEISPHLPFDNLYNSYKPSKLPQDWKQPPLSKRCHFEKIHPYSEKADIKSTPLHRAAGKGNGKAIKHMIHNGRRLSSGDTLLQMLKLKDPDSRSNKTALSLAAIAEAGELGGLYALLEFNIGIADAPDTTFKEALEYGRGNVVKAFLQQEELRKKFVDTSHILLAIQPLKNADVDEEDRKKQMEVLNTMLKWIDPQNGIDEKVVEKIIQLNLEEVWNENASILESNTSGLLHLAVQHQKIGFVKLFLQKYSESIISNSHEVVPPLWHNNYVTENSLSSPRASKNDESKKTQSEIRDLIVAATIKSKNVGKMQDLLSIFQQSGETVDELCFDLSRFNSKVYRVSNFVHSLIQHQDHANLLSYERTLKYAAFPALDLKDDEKETFGDNTPVDHKEIFYALDWLEKKKHVKDIIELTVPDRLVNPHDEVIIGKYVNKFSVEVLNWRFLDMSISIFNESDPEDRSPLQQIRELHLYASGKRAAISHWLSSDGIRSLTNLTTLEIYVVQELVTREKCRATVDFIESEFKILSDEINTERKIGEELVVSVSARPWNPTGEREADLEEIADRAVPKLSRFIKGYHTYVHDTIAEESEPFRPIRVAVIDNGILSISPSVETPLAFSNSTHLFDTSSAVDYQGDSYYNNTYNNDHQIEKDGKYRTLWSRIKKGRSFVDDDSRVSPWLFASDPHGTQMANLLCAIDPCCDLYVAKVTEGRSGITPVRVERAINWAIDQNVDIISMSFAILDETDFLRAACAKAADAGIIMLCSTHDEGLDTDPGYPSSYGDTITITACNEFGIVAPNVPRKYDYAIQGLDVAAGKVPFLESKDCISGSSVATAIAAGLSSLILACDRLAQGHKKYDRSGRSKIVKHHFARMARNTKYVILEKFAEIDTKIKDGREINAQTIIEKFFREEKYPA